MTGLTGYCFPSQVLQHLRLRRTQVHEWLPPDVLHRPGRSGRRLAQQRCVHDATDVVATDLVQVNVIESSLLLKKVGVVGPGGFLLQSAVPCAR